MTNSELIKALEILIRDPSKELSDKYFDKEGKWLAQLPMENLAVYERIYLGKSGNIGYYGITHLLDGCTNTAFYKSLDGSVYYIKSHNNQPIHYCKIE
jgi:hypothetical protein